jgi:hypothetical protein
VKAEAAVADEPDAAVQAFEAAVDSLRWIAARMPSRWRRIVSTGQIESSPTQTTRIAQEAA